MVGQAPPYHLEKCTVEQQNLLDEFRILLEKQIKLIRQGNIRGIELLSEQFDCVVKKIVQTAILEQSCFQEQRAELKELCNTLRLALASDRCQTGTQLNRIQKSRKTLNVYRNSV